MKLLKHKPLKNCFIFKASSEGKVNSMIFQISLQLSTQALDFDLDCDNTVKSSPFFLFSECC